MSGDQGVVAGVRSNTVASHMGQSQGAYGSVNVSRSMTPAGTSPRERPVGRRRINDVDEIARAMEVAALALTPDELSGRRLIEQLMPQLFVLRKKGHSFAQLTKVLNAAIGRGVAPLQSTTVKAYYHEFLVDKLDECERTFEQARNMAAEVNQRSKNETAELARDATAFKAALREQTPGKGAAMARILGERTGRGGDSGDLPVGDHFAGAAAAPPAPVVGPPPAGAKPPSAAGFDRMGGLPQAAVVPQEGHSSAVSAVDSGSLTAVQAAPAAASRFKPGHGSSVDDLPVAQPIGVAADDAISGKMVGSGKSAKPAPAASAARPGVSGVGEGVKQCLTQPTPEECHDVNSDVIDGVPMEFRSEAVLEHPCIPGLMLTKAQRMFNGRLTYSDSSGSRQETIQELRGRTKWKKPVEQTVSRTNDDFVALNSDALRKAGDS